MPEVVATSSPPVTAPDNLRRDLHNLGWPPVVPLIKLTARPGTPQQKTWQLRGAITIIGSRPNAHVRLRHDEVSKIHAAIICDGTDPILCDLLSRNGTFIGDKRVSWASLPDGAPLKVGPYELRADSQPRPGSRGKNFESGQFPAARPRRAIRFLDKDGHEALAATSGLVLVGAREGAHLHVQLDSLLPVVAMIIPWQSGWAVYDLSGEENPQTKRNGEPILSAVLASGDQLAFGEQAFVVAFGDESPTSSNNQQEPKGHTAREPTVAPAQRPADGAQEESAMAEAQRTPITEPMQGQGLSAIEQKLASIQTDLATSYQELHALRKDVDKRSAELDEREKQLNEHAETVKQLSAELDQRNEAMQQERQQLDAERADAANGKAEIEQARADIDAQRQQLEQERATVTEEAARLEAKRTETESFAQQFEAQKAELDEQRATLTADQERFSQQKNEFETQRQQLTEHQQSLDQQRQQVDNDRQTLQAERDELDQRSAKTQEEFDHLAQLEQTITAQREQLEQQFQDLAEREAKLAERDAAMEECRQALQRAVAAFEDGSIARQPKPRPQPQAAPTEVQQKPQSVPVEDAPPAHRPDTDETTVDDVADTAPDEPASTIAESPAPLEQPDDPPADTEHEGDGTVDFASLDPEIQERLRVLRRVTNGNKSDAELLQQIRAKKHQAHDESPKRGGWFRRR